MTVAPITTEEIAAESAKLLAEGGLFATQPMTIRGVDYPHVFVASSKSLRDLMGLKAMEHAQKVFIQYGAEKYTFMETWTKAMRFAHYLMQEHGVGPGDRVAVAMRNYPEWPMAFIGVIATGATVVPLNAWWQANELREGIERCGAKVVVCDAKRYGHFSSVKDELGLTLIPARETVPEADLTFADILANDAYPLSPPNVKIDPESAFCLLYTSGSTGEPKGVLLSHRSVINALLSWSFMLNVGQRLRPEAKYVPDNPSVLLALPLFHVTALHSLLLLSWAIGRRTVFLYRWDAPTAIATIEKEKITNFVGVPTMAHELVQTAKPGQLDSLVETITGGAKRPETQVLAQATKFPHINISGAYGLTETNSLVAHITLQDYIDRPGSAGRAIPPINEIEAFTEDGQKLPRGEEGEICIKSPANFTEYMDDEEATMAAFHAGGWFRTGDLGRVDEEGWVTITDRVKDLIIRGGENVSCLEVENALLSFGGIDEAAVFAVPDPVMGERVGAAIWSKDGHVDFAALSRHLAKELAPFKRPEKLWVSPQQLPRGTTGKISKKTVRDIAGQYAPHWSNEAAA